MTTMKNDWQTPQLVVLARTRPEEAVLATCKYPSTHAGPSNPNCKVPGNSSTDCQDVRSS